MRKEKSQKTISKLDPTMRHVMSSHRINQLIPKVIALNATYHNTRVICLTDELSKRIPRSREAMAFNALSENLLHYTLLKACTFWDPLDLESYSLPTIAALANDSEIESAVASEHYLHHVDFDKPFAEAQGRRSRKWLKKAILITNFVEGSPILARTKNFRDKVAHQLLHTRSEVISPIDPPKARDVRLLLRRTMLACHLFHLSLNGTDFDWRGMEEMNRRNAIDLWKRVRFDFSY